MKYVPAIVGGLLGLLFIMSSVVVLFKLVQTPEMPAGTPIASFMAATGPTGYMTFVKVVELIGGILVAIPRTRNLGLLALGPVIINIIAFHAFITMGEGLFSPMLIGISLMAVYLLWVERKSWAALVR